MSKLKIRTYPDPILKKKAKEIDKVDDETGDLVTEMKRLMREGDGVGLAGPQAGVSKRIFIIDASDGKGVRVFINPKICKKKGKQVGEEGCLSLPGLEVEIKRAKSLECEFLDNKGKEQKLKVSDLLATIIQHEIDHLDGKLLVDKVGWFKRYKLLKEYEGLKKSKEGEQNVLEKMIG
ncbi:peptide deformylase [Candidatus Falkowbacteria bacterium]|nr:peptide deformylase [Candidatus Falkowbacteria bacterium]